MQILLASILPKRSTLTNATQALLTLYLDRCARYNSTVHRTFPSEGAFLQFTSDAAARTRPYLLLADSDGQQLSSIELAGVVSRLFDIGIQTFILAIGPADGWSPAARNRADKTIAFGRITLPHELAAVVAAEQLYRSLTIRAGHPYHTGH